MDLLKIIVNPEVAKSICSICYKHQDLATSIYDIIEIHDEYLETNITLSFILKELFPNHEFFLTQACEDCTHLLLKIFILLHRSNIKTELLTLLILKMNKKIDENLCNKNLMCMIKMQIPKYQDFVKYKEKADEKLFKCKKCSMKFSCKQLLQKHREFSHKNINDAIICDMCGKVFKKSFTLQAHLKTHMKKQCPYCLKILKSHSHFNTHLKNHQTSIKRQRKKNYYNCNNCNYKSLNKLNLEAHLNKAHLNIRPYKCGMCEKDFYRKSNLTEHLRIHNKSNDNVCEVCGDNFGTKKTLDEHLRLHTGIKPFECTLCSAMFVNSGRRTEHMMRRHGEKNKSCDVCGKTFSLKKDLKSHLKVHGTV